MSFRLTKCVAILNPSLYSKMTHTQEELRLIKALYNEYVFLCHDDFDPDEDPTPEEYLDMLKEMTYDELVNETCTGEGYSLEEYLDHWV